MNPRHVYLLLCLLGTLLPYSQFVPWLLAHGLDLALFIRELFANKIGGFFGMDVFVSTAVLWTFVAQEGRRLGVRHRWAPVVASLVVGVSLGFPLFLYLRQERLENSGVNEGTDVKPRDSDSRPPS
jgi:hypothetical protein